MSNQDHSNRKLGKAGRKRWMGIRPTVRGVAMNPVDHPHGGVKVELLVVDTLFLLGQCLLKVTRPVRTRELRR